MRLLSQAEIKMEIIDDIERRNKEHNLTQENLRIAKQQVNDQLEGIAANTLETEQNPWRIPVLTAQFYRTPTVKDILAGKAAAYDSLTTDRERLEFLMALQKKAGDAFLNFLSEKNGSKVDALDGNDKLDMMILLALRLNVSIDFLFFKASLTSNEQKGPEGLALDDMATATRYLTAFLQT